MNFYSGPKMQFLKTRIFPKEINSEKNPKFDLFIKSSFFLNFGKVILFPLLFFYIGKIFEDKINKSNDPLFIILRELKYENFKISNSLRGSLSCVKFLGSTKMHENMIFMMIQCITFQIANLGCYKPTPLKMNLALEIRVGQKIGEGGP